MADGCIEITVPNTDSVPRHNSIYSHYPRHYVEQTSLEVCNIMTHLGYGEIIRRRRISKISERDSLANARFVNILSITAGSKSEGLSFWFESDLDILFVLKGVICLEAEFDILTIPDDEEVYRIDTSVYPGHCRMLLERPSTRRHNKIVNALCDDGKGNTLLSSCLFVDEYAKSKFYGDRLGRAGPSLPMTIDGHLNVDYVYAIRCQCPGILQRWAERPRHWPTADVVQTVVSLGSFVTPVGFKGSDYHFLEWRICFNMGETELVNNLNATQAKLYVILKMIVKGLLNPKKKEVTSYVLKNIIFWQAERNSPAMFQERNLIYWLHEALETLRSAISSAQLPYFMIPERNLMAACGIQDEQRRVWVAYITDMMGEGPMVILRLPKIRQAIIGHPEPLLWFSRRRMELELLMLEYMNRIMQIIDESGMFDRSDIIIQKILRRQREIQKEVHLRMLIEGNIVNDPNDLIRRILM